MIDSLTVKYKRSKLSLQFFKTVKTVICFIYFSGSLKIWCVETAFFVLFFQIVFYLLAKMIQLMLLFIDSGNGDAKELASGIRCSGNSAIHSAGN